MEQTFRTGRPLRLLAKVDRVYRLPDDSLVLVELKTRQRDRPYLSDIIQLSVQRLAVSAQTGARVETYAFVTVLRPNRRLRSHRVRLLGQEEVSRIRGRYHGILDGYVRPTYAASESACHQCALRHKCDRPDLLSNRHAEPLYWTRCISSVTSLTGPSNPAHGRTGDRWG